MEAGLEELMEEFCRGIHASSAMIIIVKQLFSYVRVSGYDIENYIKELKLSGRFPCNDKKTGKMILEDLSGKLKFHVGDEGAAGNNKEKRRYSFTHLYVEEDVTGEGITELIRDKFKTLQISEIKHYKDIFNKRHQGRALQGEDRGIILARKTGRLLYEGAPVCQDFGNKHFYYTSCVMNCLYDCEYCYLKGMYPSAYPVIFVNIEDIFRETEELLKQFPVYLCVSYDTDLMALEDLTGYVSRWCEFTKAHEDLTIEIRTKCARTDIWEKTGACERVIFAYTMSPDIVTERYEWGAPGLDARIKAVKTGMEAFEKNFEGTLPEVFPFRLCFDPMIYVSDWREHYSDMWEKICKNLDLNHIKDYSVGSFRISDSYLKGMRINYPDSITVQYPYDLVSGYYQYPKKLAEEMEDHMCGLIKETVPEGKVFKWEK